MYTDFHIISKLWQWMLISETNMWQPVHLFNNFWHFKLSSYIFKILWTRHQSHSFLNYSPYGYPTIIQVYTLYDRPKLNIIQNTAWDHLKKYGHKRSSMYGYHINKLKKILKNGISVCEYLLNCNKIYLFLKRTGPIVVIRRKGWSTYDWRSKRLCYAAYLVGLVGSQDRLDKTIGQKRWDLAYRRGITYQQNWYKRSQNL